MNLLKKDLGWLLAVVALAGGIFLAGCDDHVVFDRDSAIPIDRGMTWAWRSSAPAPEHRTSRDFVGRGPNGAPAYRRSSDWENDIVRNRVAHAFEQELNARGLRETSDPNQADFLVDFQFAVNRRRERVATPVYSSGLVCGYRGCWDGFWGPPGVYVHSVQYREGTIEFDLFSHDLNRLAYRAVRENVVHRNSFSDEEIREGVKHLLKGLKPH